MSTAGEPVPQRIGDAERDRAVEWLREHRAQGRLDDAEFEERLTVALTAKTSRDLEPLFGDLPAPRPGQELAVPVFTAPPWQAKATGPARPSPPAVRPNWNVALATTSALIWPITILLITFVLGWDDFWWLVFLPIAFSSALGKDHGNRERARARIEADQQRRDRRRRELDG